MKRKKFYNKHGFTLVEMLIIAPIVILVIGIFISAIVNMTGSVLSSRGANVLSYNINDALTRIDQDVKSGAGFLSTNNISLSSGQGLDDATAIFHNASSSSATDPELIINSYATDQNPLTSTRNIIDAASSPFPCSSTFVTQNANFMTNIIYFVKSGTLWRRVIMPSNYNSGGGCAIPWQKPTCTPGYNPVVLTFCKANDQRLVDGVTTFAVTYWTNAVPPVQIANASDYLQTDNTRKTALQTASSVKVSITATKNLSGRNITQTGSVQSLGIQGPSMLTQPTNQVVTAGSAANFATTAYGTNMTIKWEQSTDQGVTWTTVSGATSSTLSLSGTTGLMDGNLYHVIYTNSYGQITSSPARLNVNATGWTPLTYQNSWSDYLNGYNTGRYLKTTSGVVTLSGLIKRTGTPVQQEVIGILPPGYRPSAPIMFGVSTNPNVSGRIDIYPNGEIRYIFGDLTWLSLENIHFIADTGRYNSNPINIFMNGWSNYSLGGFGQASYVVDSIGRVHLQGLLLPGTRDDGVRIFDMPSSLLPSAYMHIPEQCNGFTGMGIDYRPGYSAILDKSLGINCFSINAMYYPAAYDANWSNLTLQNSWTWYGSIFSTPQYIKAADGLVSIRGLIKGGTVTDDTIIATLPTGYRPGLRALFATYANAAVARIDIDSAGNIRWKSGSNFWYSLDGIAFYAEL